MEYDGERWRSVARGWQLYDGLLRERLRLPSTRSCMRHGLDHVRERPLPGHRARVLCDRTAVPSGKKLHRRRQPVAGGSRGAVVMIAIPAIDLRDGACVQLVGGSYSDERLRDRKSVV